MSRLNKAMRDTIVKNAIVKSPVTSRKAAYEKRRTEWVEKCRIESLGGQKAIAGIEKALAKAKQALEGVPAALLKSNPGLKTNYEIYLNVAGCKVHGDFGFTPDRDRNYLPCMNGSPNNPFAITADNPLAVEFFELEKEREAIKGIEVEIRAQARAVVESCSTVKKLLEVWPEAVELLPAVEAAAVAGLPSVNVQSLNALVGLPTE